MSISCPHCLETIGWHKAWLAFIPGGRITCHRCQSQLSNTRSARTNQLVAIGLIGFMLTMCLWFAFPATTAIAIGTNIVSVLSIILVLMGLLGLGRLRVVRSAGRFCYRCGYDLTANASGKCPECGGDSPVPVDWAQFRDEPLPVDLAPKPAPPPAEFELKIPASQVDPTLVVPPRDDA